MNFHKELWLLLSGFGIMFAILSWLQDSGILFPEPSPTKGIIALIIGSILYLLIAKKME
jgi:hypothetical protein|tara:strand:- start:183 stop:359 length:177 start_codon:yes stop_codon:yes gene_type:complete